MEISPEVSAAYDILTGAGIDPEKAAQIALTSEQMWKQGINQRTPEQFARHFLTLRKAALGG